MVYLGRRVVGCRVGRREMKGWGGERERDKWVGFARTGIGGSC